MDLQTDIIHKPKKVIITRKQTNIINKEPILDTIIKSIVNEHILDLLKIINRKYPDKFQKDKIELEFELIKKSIEYYKINTKTNNISRDYKSKESRQTLLNNENEKRCNARIWGKIYDRNLNTEIIQIDSKYNVTDFEDIKIKSFHKKYKIGCQCKREYIEGNKYCKQHTIRKPHGDYFEEPSKELVFHFMKNNKYI